MHGATFSRPLGSQGDKVVKMNIDGVDASIEGIVQVDIPASWASLSVEGEARVGSVVSWVGFVCVLVCRAW